MKAKETDAVPGHWIEWKRRTRAGSLVWWLNPEEPTGVVTYLMVEAAIEGTEQLVGQYGCSAEIRAYDFDIYDGGKKAAYGHMMMDVLCDSTSSNLTANETSQSLTELTRILLPLEPRKIWPHPGIHSSSIKEDTQSNISG